MSEWFVNLGYETQLATWLVASFLLYTLSAQLAWQFHWYFPSSFYPADDHADYRAADDWEQSEGAGGLVVRVRHLLLNPWVEEAIRFIYYLGVPFLAALNGLLPADLLGISGTDWANGQSVQGFAWEEWVRGLGLVVLTIAVMMGVWVLGRFVARRERLVFLSQGLPGSLWQRLLHAFYDQIHWAFYRSGPILWLDSVYWGTFVGLALALAEVALNPSLRWSLRSSDTAGPPLFRLGMAWITALLFLTTQNLWLALAVHMILAALMGGREAGGYMSVYESTE